MMAVDIRTLFARLHPSIFYFSDTGAHISIKQASTNFPRIFGYKYHNYNTISLVEGFGNESEEDALTLKSFLYPCSLYHEQIGNEGDVGRLYYRYLSGTVMNALQLLHIIERSETGPTGDTQVTDTVDSRFTLGDIYITIVEFKRPHLVRSDHWADSAHGGLTTKNILSKELRM